MTKEQLYQRAAELFRQAVADGADEALARAKYDAAIARIASMPDGPKADAATAKPGPVPRTDYGFGRAVAQGATFGFADEIEAGAKALLPNRTYAGEVADVRAAKAKYDAENPKMAFAGEMIGGLATSAVPVLGAARIAQNASRLQRVGAMMASGAASSGLSGLGASEGTLTERLPDAGLAAAVGAVLAPAIGGIAGKVAGSRPVRAITARATGAAEELLPRAYEKALDYAGRAFARDRGALPDALTGPAPAGDLVFNRGGRGVANATRVAQAIPSEATDYVPRAIAAQLDAEPGRVVDALSRATGRPIGNAAERLQELSRRAAEAADPAYRPMHGEVFGDEALDALMARPSVRSAVAQGRRNLADKGWKPPVVRGEFEPVADEAVARALPGAAQSATAADVVSGKTERGLWPTAKTTAGGTRPVEQVDTQGLLDDLLRRRDLEVMYYKNTRKYGPNSAVTRRNTEQMNRILDVLMERDKVPFEMLDDVLKMRRAEIAREMGGEVVTTRDLERIVHAQPKAPKAAVATPDPVATMPAVAEEVAEEVTPQAGYIFEELNNAKKVLDADISDLRDKVAKGIDQSTNQEALSAKVEARAALIDYMDNATNGRFAEARGVAEAFIRPREAFRAGTGYGPATSRDALRVEQATRTPAERSAYAEGVAHRIRDDVDRTMDRRNIASRFFGSPLERDKLASVFGADSPVADALSAATRRREQATAALVPGQSMTTPLREAVDDFRGGSLLDLAMQAKSLPRTVMMQLARRVAQLRGVDEEAAGILGRIMTATPGSEEAQLLAAQFRRLELQRQAAQAVGRQLGQSTSQATINAGRQ